MVRDDILFAYFVTGNRFDRLRKSIGEQVKIDIALSNQSYLISDEFPSESAEIICDYFEDRIITSDPYVVDLNNRRLFSFSKLRNAAIKVARESSASWMYFCDADTVFTTVSLPNDGEHLTVPDVYWQKSSEETVDQSMLEIAMNGSASFSQGNSWYILNRAIFDNLDFNEQIFGYGWEDLEFFIRIQAKGFSLSRCNTRVIHMYHSQEDRDVDWPQFNRNKSIFEAVQIEVQNQYSPDWKNSEQLQTSHPAWVAELYFDYTNAVVVNPLSKTANRFDAYGERYVIRWNDWPAEVFRRDKRALIYIGPDN